MCMPPFEQKYELKGLKVLAALDTKTDENNNVAISVDTNKSSIKVATSNVIDTSKTKIQQAPTPKEEGFLSFLIIAFLGGLIAVITPYVFPMLPMTVSFFTKKRI